MRDHLLDLALLCSTAPQAFFRPDRVLSPPARTDGCQGWPLFSGHPSGLRPLQRSSTTAGLMGRGVDYTPVCYLSVLSVSTHYSDNGCLVFFGRPCYEVHGACDNRINLYPAAPIRLAKVLLAWTIAQEGWGSSFKRQIGKCQFAMRANSHTSDLPDTPRLGWVGTQRTVDVIA